MTRAGTINVDATSPTAQITAPASNGVLRDTVSISGTASDANIATYSVEYGPASGTGPWNSINSATTSVNNGTLATWVTSDPMNAIIIPNGSYLLRLTVTDKAENTSIVIVPVNTDNLIISNVGASSNTINTDAAETSTVFFNINSQATVTLNIIPEKLGPTGTPVYQTGKVCAAGACSFIWDGKDNTGKVVPDEAYLFVLTAAEGTRNGGYSPVAPTGMGTVTCSQSSNFDFASNQPMTITYSAAQPSRVNINISWGSLNFKILDSFPVLSGDHTVVWDGSNPNNKLLDIGAKSACTVASLLRENFILTTGDAVQIRGLKTDPYMMHLAYGHFMRIKYTLSKDAYVTVKLISPTGSILTLVNNQLQTADPPEIEWNGMDASDATGKNMLVTEEGDYMVSVQAVNPITGTSSIAKANVRIGY